MTSPARQPLGLLGIEHEFRVFAPDGSLFDFSTLLPTLALDGRRLDPGDKNACRLRSGIVITADGAEAEIAIPPVPVCPGFARRAVGFVDSGRKDLQAALPKGFQLKGYSTHISVSVPGELALEAASSYAVTFAPVLAFFLENRDSQGVFVRPRPGRLEFCGDYLSGDRLVACLALAWGSIRSCTNSSAPGANLQLPKLDLQLAPARERFGYRVHRTSPGFDMYENPRASRFPLLGGGEITGEELLARAWRMVEPGIAPLVSSGELNYLRSIVHGHSPLGVERPGEDPPPVRRWQPGLGPSRITRPPEGQVVDPIVRPGFVVRPVVATWEFAVLAFDSGRHTAFLPILRERLGETLAKLRRGELDGAAAAFLSLESSGPALESRSDLDPPRFFSAMGDPARLLPLEPAPSSHSGATSETSKPGRTATQRPGKSVAPISAHPPVLPVRPAAPATASVWRNPLLTIVAIAAGLAIVSAWILLGFFPLEHREDGASPKPPGHGTPTAGHGAGPAATIASPTPATTPTVTATASLPSLPTLAPTLPGTATQAPAASPSPVPTVRPAATLPAPSPSPTQSPVETQPPTPTATLTAGSTATPSPTASPTVSPTETPAPTDTPLATPVGEETAPPATPTVPGAIG